MTRSVRFHATTAQVLATMMLVALGVACSDDSSGGGGGAGSAGSAGASGSGNAGNDTGGGDGPGPALTLTQYCEKVTKIEQDWCAYSQKCCSDDDRKDYMYNSYCPVTGATTVSECVDSYQELLDSKEAVFDGTWAEQCITESLAGVPRAPSTCQGLGLPDPSVGHGDPVARQIAACRKTFRGQIAKGEKCAYGYGCAGDLRCSNGTGTASGDYLCREAGTFGTPCITSSDCLSGYFCVPSGSTGACDKPGSQGASCRSSNECQEGLVCAGLKCVRPLDEGDACGSGDVCGVGMGCFYASSTSTKSYCEPRRVDGTSCVLSNECAGRCDEKTKKCVSLCGG